MQFLLSLLLGLLLGVLFGGGVAVWAVAQRMRRRSLTGGAPRLITAHIQVRRDDAWFRGDDLLRYPRRLGELQARLVEQQEQATSQAAHLVERRAELEGRPEREDLVRRYTEDARLLERRAERMARVLGIVWKTRALLALRAHVAVTARRRPLLDGLPEGEVPQDALEQAAVAYDRAANAVRAFVGELDSRANDLDDVMPVPPAQALITEPVRLEVEGERVHTLQTYSTMRDRMDALADNLVYLADRCRTRAVVEGGPGAIDAGPGSEALLDELNRALGGLAEMVSVGDQKLADAAMDNLAEDISQLERAGLDAQAETDAVLEVQRLLDQFPGG